MLQAFIIQAILAVRFLWEEEREDNKTKLKDAATMLYEWLEQNDHKLFGFLPSAFDAAAQALVDNRTVDNYQYGGCYVLVEHAYQIVKFTKVVKASGLSLLQGWSNSLDDFLDPDKSLNDVSV